MREQGFAADALGSHHKATRAIHRPPRDAVPGSLFDGNRFAGHHGFVNCTCALQDHTIHRYFFTRPHSQAVARLDAVEHHLFFLTVVMKQERSLGRKLEEGLQRTTGAASGTEFEHLTQQHEGGNGCGRFKIHWDITRGQAERIRKQLRDERGKETVQICRACADRSQRKHIETAVRDGSPAALKERPASPKHHRSSQGKLDPGQEGRGQDMPQVRRRKHGRHRHEQ